MKKLKAVMLWGCCSVFVITAKNSESCDTCLPDTYLVNLASNVCEGCEWPVQSGRVTCIDPSNAWVGTNFASFCASLCGTPETVGAIDVTMSGVSEQAGDCCPFPIYDPFISAKVESYSISSAFQLVQTNITVGFTAWYAEAIGSMTWSWYDDTNCMAFGSAHTKPINAIIIPRENQIVLYVGTDDLSSPEFGAEYFYGVSDCSLGVITNQNSFCSQLLAHGPSFTSGGTATLSAVTSGGSFLTNLTVRLVPEERQGTNGYALHIVNQCGIFGFNR